MNRMLVIYVGLLATVLASYLGLVHGSHATLPAPLRTAAGDDLVAQGRRAYIGLGCVYCHSQQLRPAGFGADLQRGWGVRRTDVLDYVDDSPPLLGTMRTGPDLAAIGARQPLADWQYAHLYDPQRFSPGSNMPKFPFLFDRVRSVQAAPLGAVTTPPGMLSAGEYLVPTDEARALVTYLLALDKTKDPEPAAIPARAK